MASAPHLPGRPPEDRRALQIEPLVLCTYILGVLTFAVGVATVFTHFFVGTLILCFGTVLIVIAHKVGEFQLKVGDFQMKSKNRP